MKKQFQKAAALTMSAAMALQLAACGTAAASSTAFTSTATESTEASSTASAETSGSDEQVTLTMSWWGGDSRHEATMKAIEAFEADNPNIKVETQYGAWGGWLEQLTVQMASGQEPDVMQINWNWIYQFSPTGDGFTDLNEYKDIIDLSQYPESLLDDMTVEGKLQGVPIASTGKVFYWNKTTFDKAGIAIPTSFADMIEAGHVFQEKLGDDYYPMALTSYEQMLLMVYYLQQKYDKPWIADGKVNFTEEQVAEGLDFIQMLEDEHVMPTQREIAADGATTMDKNTGWIEGRYAGFYEWDSSANKFANALADGQELVIGEYPYDYGDVKTATAKIAMAYAIKKNSAHPKEAAMLIEYLLDNQKAVEIVGTERGVVANANAQAILEKSGQLSGLVYESNKLAMANAGFGLDPYFEDSKLKDNTGLYFEIFEELSYDRTSTAELAPRLIEGINEVEADNGAA